MTASLGNSIMHDSAELHVQGSAIYVDDICEPQGLLHVVPGYARQGACGLIARMDLQAAQNAPGVVAILTARDIPGRNDCSPSLGGDPILAENEIYFHGQVVFAVVAKTREQARRAARLVKIEIAEVKPAVTVDDALTEGTQDILPPYQFQRGKVSAQLKQSARAMSDQFTIGGQEHFYLEGQVSLAVPGEQGAMLVYCSTQHPTEVQHCVAAMLGIADAKVTCECRRMGGGFGGKESQAAQWACLSALASHVTGRPAKCRLDRDDDMIMTGKRHDFKVQSDFSFDEQGKIEAVHVRFYSRCGYSADLSQGVNDRTMFHADNAYYYPHVKIESRRLRTNTVSNTAFRGFGGPQGMLFAERMMEQIAISTKRDALDVRKDNFYSRGRTLTPYGQEVTDNVISELVTQLEKSSDYRARRSEIQRFNTESAILKRGLSLTPVKFGISFTLTQMNQAGALVHVYTDGSVQLNHAGTEMGQGLYIKVAQVVADSFAIPLGQVRITATTTDKVPNTSPTAASSGTDLNAMAAQAAAEEIKSNIASILAADWGVSKKDIVFANGRVSAGRKSKSFAEAAKVTHQARAALSASGFYATPKIHWDRKKAEGRPFYYFAYGAACSEVVIDTLTGEMKVLRTDILHDVGKSLNPAIDIGQIEGAFVQGMGWLTTEELVFDEKGRLRTHAPSTYKIPCASDLPKDFRVALFENSNREDTIYRSKAVGEPPLMLAISVWTAIHDAIASLKPGTIPRLDAPATPEAILRAVESMT